MEQTFLSAAKQFWERFGKVQSEMHDEIIATQQHDDLGECHDTIDAFFDLLHPLFGDNASFQFHVENGTFNVYLSPDGDKIKAFMIRCLIDCAPAIPGWSFVLGKPLASSGDTDILTIGDNELHLKDVIIYPTIDPGEEKIHVIADHPLLRSMDDEKKSLSLFLMIDHVIGEIATETWIGDVRFMDSKTRVDPATKPITLSMLKQFIDRSLK
jgi:hypothetical protein